MHIVMVTSFPYDPQRINGGVAAVARYLSAELLYLPGVKLTIIDLQGQAGETKVENWPNLTVYRIVKIPQGCFLPPIVYSSWIRSKQIQSLLVKLKPDVVHYQGEAHLITSDSFPSVLTIHGIQERDALWTRKGLAKYLQAAARWFFESKGRNRAKNIIVISPYVRNLLGKSISHARIWDIENPVADTFFSILRSPELGRIFCCSSVIPRKNTAGMIQAFAQIVRSRPYARLFIAGSAERNYLDLCKNLAADLKVQEQVVWLGSLSILQVQEQLAKAICLVIPSFQETAPVAIEEAMAAGVPVVGSNLCGIPYMVENGKTGYLINPVDTEDIASAVGKILDDKGLADQMSQNARIAASERFRASMVAKKTWDVYREVIEKTASE